MAQFIKLTCNQNEWLIEAEHVASVVEITGDILSWNESASFGIVMLAAEPMVVYCLQSDPSANSGRQRHMLVVTANGENPFGVCGFDNAIAIPAPPSDALAKCKLLVPTEMIAEIRLQQRAEVRSISD
jgi:hypothetical protein